MLQALNARVVSIEQAKQRTKQTALWTANTHKVKDALNQSQLEDMESNGATFINVYARHFHVQTSGAGGKRKRASSRDSVVEFLNTSRAHEYVAWARHLGINVVLSNEEVQIGFSMQMFTKWAYQIKAINAEYARLRALPHWRSIIAFAVTNEENKDIHT